MKKKIFITSFIFLCVTAIAVSSIHFYFFKTERMRLIDQQVEAIASSLFASELSINELDDLEEAQNIISDVLGERRMIALITIIDPFGHVQYRNRAATVLDLPVYLNPRWQTLVDEGHTVRALNLRIPNSSWSIQVGLLLDEVQVEWRSLSRYVYFYIGIILLLMLSSAFVLTRLLLLPMRALSAYLRHFADSVGTSKGARRMPASLENKINSTDKRDEFGELILSVNELATKLQSRFRLSQGSAAQMAHEFKTPLTIVKNSLEGMEQDLGLRRYERMSERIKEAHTETDHLNVVISEFLEWSRAESDQTAKENLYAIHVKSVVEESMRRLEGIYPKRLQLDISEDFVIFARPEWAQQFFVNLFENALKYSPSTEAVEIKIRPQKISVIDRGPGISKHVIDRLGQPFNVDPSLSKGRSSTGLGLAWVQSIAKLYGWALEFRPGADGVGTEVRVEFGG